jgi:hypothetical protein
MSSDQSQASADAVRLESGLARGAYAQALPALQSQYGFIGQSLAEGGEPQGLRNAFNVQRTGLTEMLARQGIAQQRQALGQQQGAALHGNASGYLTPQNVGASIADQVYTSRLNEGLGRIEQMNKLVAMGLGQSAQVGNAGIGAGQAQLQGIAGLPQYNSTYANVVGGLNLAGSLYGAYQQNLAQQGAAMQSQNAYNQGLNAASPGGFSPGYT